jgi:microcystin degradation protein MlrC
MSAGKTPVVLVDMGDNIGGGSAGDSTFVLAELVKQKAQGWVFVLADPEAVETAVRSGVGQAFRARVGGKRDRLHGEPIEISGRVRLIYDGKFVETEIRHGGQRYHDQGLTVVVEVPGGADEAPNLLMLTSLREPPFSLHQLLSAGIQPQRQKILVVKAAIAFRAAYEPIAGRIIEVDTGGVTAVNPARFTYRKVRRPLWGLQP